MVKVFFSYCHADEALRDRLEVHFAMLKREGLIESWHDRRIVAGSDVDDSIRENLEEANVILLLVSADFIASEYCYSKEMARAIERHAEKSARVIPIILQPCDWRRAPFGKLLAAPKDGKAITTWPNIEEAFTDVAKQIRRAVEALHPDKSSVKAAPAPERAVTANPTEVPKAELATSVVSARSSNLRLRKEFSDYDRDQFVQSTFEFMARFFETSLQELAERNPGIKGQFQRIDGQRFSAVIYRNGESIAQCSVRLESMGGRTQHVVFSFDASAARGSSNEMLYFESDSQSMYLTALGMQSGGGSREAHLSENGASEHLWALLIGPVQG